MNGTTFLKTILIWGFFSFLMVVGFPFHWKTCVMLGLLLTIFVLILVMIIGSIEMVNFNLKKIIEIKEKESGGCNGNCKCKNQKSI